MERIHLLGFDPRPLAPESATRTLLKDLLVCPQRVGVLRSAQHEASVQETLEESDLRLSQLGRL